MWRDAAAEAGRLLRVLFLWVRTVSTNSGSKFSVGIARSLLRPVTL
jgi:hypothetical protein